MPGCEEAEIVHKSSILYAVKRETNTSKNCLSDLKSMQDSCELCPKHAERVILAIRTVSLTARKDDFLTLTLFDNMTL